MGFILGSWQLVYTFAVLGMGVLIDHFGPKIMIGVGTAFIALPGIARSESISFETPLFLVMIFGIGGPAVSVGIPKMFPCGLRRTENE